MTDADQARKIRAIAQKLDLLAHELDHPRQSGDAHANRGKLVFDVSDNGHALHTIAKELAQ